MRTRPIQRHEENTVRVRIAAALGLGDERITLEWHDGRVIQIQIAALSPTYREPYRVERTMLAEAGIHPEEAGWTVNDEGPVLPGPSACRCRAIQAGDPLRHFKGCPKRRPLPEEDQAAIDAAHTERQGATPKAEPLHPDPEIAEEVRADMDAGRKIDKAAGIREGWHRGWTPGPLDGETTLPSAAKAWLVDIPGRCEAFVGTLLSRVTLRSLRDVVRAGMARLRRPWRGDLRVERTDRLVGFIAENDPMVLYATSFSIGSALPYTLKKSGTYHLAFVWLRGRLLVQAFCLSFSEREWTCLPAHRVSDLLSSLSRSDIAPLDVIRLDKEYGLTLSEYQKLVLSCYAQLVSADRRYRCLLDPEEESNAP